MATRKTARGKATKAASRPAKKKTAAPKAAAGRKTKPVRAKAKPSLASAKPAKASAKPVEASAKPVKASAKVSTKASGPAKAASKKAGPAPKGGGVDVGSTAPSFALKDQSGAELDSASLGGAPYVLYFYPKDDTSGCTKEACGFRDSLKGFGKVKRRVIGVSPDSEVSHERFAKKYGLPFTLLSDPDKTLANSYGVWVKKQNYGREYMGILRSTFVVDRNGKVAKAYRGVRVDGHVPAVLEAVQSLA